MRRDKNSSAVAGICTLWRRLPLLLLRTKQRQQPLRTSWSFSDPESKRAGVRKSTIGSLGVLPACRQIPDPEWPLAAPAIGL